MCRDQLTELQGNEHLWILIFFIHTDLTYCARCTKREGTPKSSAHFAACDSRESPSATLLIHQSRENIDPRIFTCIDK